MEQITTKDGSITLRSNEFDETYHSHSGALEEALKKYVEPCKIVGGMQILDIGFGLGYNVGMALHHAENVDIVSLEKELVDLSRIVVPPWFESSYQKVRHAAVDLHFKDDVHEVTIIKGDAMHTIQKVAGGLDAVFLDPFSPPKNPELWTLEFFKEVRKRMKQGAILATYSCAGVVRRNLAAAGFIVKDGPAVGRRAPGTLGLNSTNKD